MTRSRNSTLCRAGGLVSLFCLALLTGCNSSRNQEVNGVVTFDGTPLEDGQIEFSPTVKGSGPTAGSSIEDGKYQIPAVTQGLIVGAEYRVSITSMVGDGTWVIHPTDPAGKRERLKNIIPERYNTESKLQATIKRGETILNFELLSAPKVP